MYKDREGKGITLTVLYDDGGDDGDDDEDENNNNNNNNCINVFLKGMILSQVAKK